MSLIVDASIATKWVADEPGSDRARELYLSDECWAPSLIMAEVGNALWKKQRMKIVTVEQAVAALKALSARIRQFEIADLAPRAAAIAAELDHPIYDCFYLALAERERVALVSADERLLRVVRKVKRIEVRAL
ncbi:MAG: type II toxin-antitoxin system VapC family toxin [Acidimicrobiia bacterium]|nr:type II toxin-antitoxin system VapC family toxin [Acidimicrobiia bacterium]